ncbi:MAG TPA: hypothetical protein VIM14_21915 [Polyangia bacterium]
MSCPSDERLVQAELGEITLNESGLLERHLAECLACAQRRDGLRQLAADLERPHEGADEAFVAAVMAARATASAPAKVRRPARVRVAWLSAAAVLLLGLGIEIHNRHGRGHDDTWTARGRRHEVQASQPTSEILAVRGEQLRPIERQPLLTGDAFAVRYVNPGPERYYLAAFALDAVGTVHWIYPEYVDGATDPGSIPLPTARQETLLPQVVEPDKPAAGAMQVIALLTPEPVSVKQVETALQQAPNGVPVAQALARAIARPLIREWRTSWNVR